MDPYKNYVDNLVLILNSNNVSLDRNSSTDYKRPMKPFFIEIPNFWPGVGRQFGQIYFGAFVILLVNLSAPMLVLFSINQPLFLQKLSLYIQIPNIYLGLGF